MARGDLADFFWPMKCYTASRWLEGGLPLWNPLSGGGEPWLAQLQTGVLYLLDLPFLLLPFPWSSWAGLFLHIAVASSGMALWLYKLGTSRSAALTGGLVFSLGAPFLSLAPVYNNFCTASFLPWVFLGGRTAAIGGSPLALAFPSALAFLAGEPALAVASTGAAVLISHATRQEGETRLTPVPGAIKRLAIGCLLAFGISAAAALPFLELVSKSGRISNTTKEESVARAVSTNDLADLVLPPRMEHTREGTEGRGGYLVSLALGTPILFLTVAAGAGFPGRGRLLTGIALTALFGLLFALGRTGLLMPLLYESGLTRGLRFPARWFVFVHFAISFFAAAGLDGWLYGDFKGKLSRWAARAAGLVISATVAFTFLTGDLARGRDPFRGGLVLALTGLLAALVVLARHHGERRLRLSGPLALLFSVGPLPFIAFDALEAVPVENVPRGPGRLLGLPDPGGGRIFSSLWDAPLLGAFTREGGTLWTPRTPALSASGLAGYTNLWERIPAINSASPISNPLLMRFLGSILAGGTPTDVLALANVTSLVSPFRVSIPGARAVRESNGVLRYTIPSPSGKAFFVSRVEEASDDQIFRALTKGQFRTHDMAMVSPGKGPLPRPRTGASYAAARVTRNEDEEIEIVTAASHQKFLVISRAHDAGFSASIDGQSAPLRRANLMFMGLTVPQGEHRIVITYRPLSFLMGAVISVLSLLTAAGIYLNTPGDRP